VQGSHEMFSLPHRLSSILNRFPFDRTSIGLASTNYSRLDHPFEQPRPQRIYSIGSITDHDTQDISERAIENFEDDRNGTYDGDCEVNGLFYWICKSSGRRKNDSVSILLQVSRLPKLIPSMRAEFTSYVISWLAVAPISQPCLMDN
jgi:hypothetical protein